MICLTTTTSNGYVKHYVSAQNIARITEADTSSQWHGIRSVVRLHDGGLLECGETADAIYKAVEKEQSDD